MTDNMNDFSRTLNGLLEDSRRSLSSQELYELIAPMHVRISALEATHRAGMSVIDTPKGWLGFCQGQHHILFHEDGVRGGCDFAFYAPDDTSLADDVEAIEDLLAQGPVRRGIGGLRLGDGLVVALGYGAFALGVDVVSQLAPHSQLVHQLYDAVWTYPLHYIGAVCDALGLDSLSHVDHNLIYAGTLGLLPVGTGLAGSLTRRRALKSLSDDAAHYVYGYAVVDPLLESMEAYQRHVSARRGLQKVQEGKMRPDDFMEDLDLDKRIDTSV